jgi:hypothetical protein
MNTYSLRSLVLPVLLTIVHQAAAGNGNFAPVTSYQVGFGPACVAAVDINGNGKIALISANLLDGIDGNLTVLTNNGSGGFGYNATLVVGSYPFGVAAADVNGDGKPDLISANLGDGNLTVLTNNGSGGFGFNATLNAGLSVYSAPAFVMAVDVNGDGKPDLISANSGDDTVTVLTNNGSGGFVLDATLTVGAYPVSVAAVDINGNGKIALVSANEFDGTLTVLTNDGHGGFGYNATLNVGSSVPNSGGPASVVAADINGNHKPGLICANSVDNTLIVLTNNGSGGFGSNATLVVGSGPLCVTATEVNGDGRPDLVCANSGDGTLTVLTNNGSGGFGSHATLTVGFFAGSYPQSVVAADVNGDGLPDLVSANYSDNSLSVLLNGALGSPSLTISLTDPHTVVISWPSPSDGFGLQQNSNLSTTNWPDFSGTVTTNGTTKSATISPATNNLFFRLRHP